MAAKDIDPRVLRDVIVLLTELDDPAYRLLGHTRAINVRKVLAYAWNPSRLQRCMAHLEAGDVAPPIHVSRYWLHGEAWYVLSDGNHRTAAARSSGRTKIRAQIGSETACRPDRYVLDAAARKLWRRTDKPGWLKLAADSLPDDVMAALRDVGVTERT